MHARPSYEPVMDKIQISHVMAGGRILAILGYCPGKVGFGGIREPARRIAQYSQNNASF